MRRAIAVILSSGLLAAALIASLLIWQSRSSRAAPADYELDARTFDAPHLRMVADKAGLTFPAGSSGTNLKWIASRSIDPTLLARIELPADRAPDFLNQLHQLPPEDIHPSALPHTETPWWPHDPNPALLDLHFTHHACPIHIIIRLEQSRHVVYIEWAQI